MERDRRALFPALLLLGTWALLEGVSWLGLTALERFGGIEVGAQRRFRLHETPRSRIPAILAADEFYYMFSPTLGWTIKPGGVSKRYRANAQGIRADVDYALETPAGVLRIAAFGDSFVHGTEVENHETWPAILSRARRKLQVLNFGAGAYGIDQSLLRYREDGVPFSPHIVLIGFMSENVFRSVNTFRPFYQPRQIEVRAKPRFALDGERLLLHPNPLATREAYRELLDREEEVIQRLGAHDFYYQTRYRPSALDFLPSARLVGALRAAFADDRILRNGRYNPRSEAFRVTVRVIETFYAEALANGSLPIVALFPDRSDIERHRAGDGRRYEPLLRALGAEGLRSVDVVEAFDGRGAPETIAFRPGGHYAPEMNRLVAEYLLTVLHENGLLSPARVAAEVARERARREIAPTPGPRARPAA